MISFFAMLPAAWLTLYLWPSVQHGILGLQTFFVESGAFGVWLFTALERILIPTGLHHFIYTPFQFGNVVTPNGITVDWFTNLEAFTQSSQSMKELFPAGGFSLHGNSKVFGCAGIALAMYHTAKPENRKKVAALLIPATFTAILVGITEPLEFTFLFIAPWLFAIHAVLAGTMAMVMYSFGVVGNMGGGLIEFVTGNWIPLLGNHTSMVVTQIAIGLSFTVIYYVVFKFLIVKFDVPIAGRGNAEMKLHTKEDFNNKHGITEKGAKRRQPTAGAGDRNSRGPWRCRQPGRSEQLRHPSARHGERPKQGGFGGILYEHRRGQPSQERQRRAGHHWSQCPSAS